MVRREAEAEELEAFGVWVTWAAGPIMGWSRLFQELLPGVHESSCGFYIFDTIGVYLFLFYDCLGNCFVAGYYLNRRFLPGVEKGSP